MSNIQYYTEEEKKILINFFTVEGVGSKKNFNTYLDNYIKKNGKRVAEHLLLKENINWQSSTKEVLLNSANWIYSSEHMLWGNEQQDNAVTYLLSLQDYNASGSSVKHLAKLRPNWNHQNKDGNTALHLFAEERIYSCIEKLLEIADTIDTYIENKKGETFGKILLDKALLEVKDDYNEKEFIRFITFIQKLPVILNKNGQALYNLPIEELKNYINSIEPAIEKLMYNITKIDRFNHGNGRNITKDYYKNLELYLNEVYYYAEMNNTIPNKNNIMKKTKI